MNYRKFIICQSLFVFIVTFSLSFAKINSNLFALKLKQNQSSEKYPFKASDGIYINTFPDTSSFLNRIFPIDDKGYTEFPIVGKVQVTSMTSDDLINFLKSTFKQYLRYPNVYVKPVVRISLLGGFTKPGLYYVDINSSLWDAVYQAGGTIKENGIYEMHWERNEEDKSDDITRLFESGISLREMGFKSGDQIWTPSPGAKTFWDTISEMLPIVTTATSLYLLYYNYQRDTALLNSRRY